MPNYGDTREDGFTFIGTVKSGPRAGQEKWISPSANAARIERTRSANAEREARRKVDADFRRSSQAKVSQWFREDYRRGMLHRARAASKQHGIPCNLESIEDIPYVTRCPIFGVELVMGSGTNHKWSPSLDKIVPSKGYVKGNIIVVSHFANSIKSNAAPDQIMAVAKFYKKLVSVPANKVGQR